MVIYFIGLKGLNELICVGHLEYRYLLTKRRVNICYYYYYMPGNVLYNRETAMNRTEKTPVPMKLIF